MRNNFWFFDSKNRLIFCTHFANSQDFKLLKRNQKREHRIEHPIKQLKSSLKNTKAQLKRREAKIARLEARNSQLEAEAKKRERQTYGAKSEEYYKTIPGHQFSEFVVQITIAIRCATNASPRDITTQA